VGKQAFRDTSFEGFALPIDKANAVALSITGPAPGKNVDHTRQRLDHRLGVGLRSASST
jgi:hypothetical protein